MNRPRTLARAGFTLVELLVSITLTIFILALFATLFGAGNDAVRAARGSGEVDRSVQGSITKIRRDLDHVFIGEGIKLSEAFASPNTIPNAGYFTLEENLPASLPWYVQSADAANTIPNNTPAHDTNFKARVQAINARLQITRLSGYTGPAQPAVGYRQGIDDRGLPVEVDVDDVLAFTVRLSGDSPSDVFYGRVPVGSVLDNDLDPGSRFDSPNNGQFTSPMAEVCYFLRADRPYELAEINRPALGTDDGRLAAAATYTLYRRELLVLSESQRVKVEERLLQLPGGSASVLTDMRLAVSTPPGIAANQSIVGTLASNPLFNASVYHNYDLAVRFDPFFGILRFNDVVSLRLRQNRYGMQWIGGGVFPSPDALAALGRVRNPQFCLPFYDHVALVGGLDVSAYWPNPPVGTYPAGVLPIYRGRPTLLESTLVGFQGIQPADNVNYNPDINTSHASWNFLNPTLGFDNPNAAGLPRNRRGNSDVLLQNVLSFDVKILNDDVYAGTTRPPIRNDQSTAWVPGTDLQADLNPITLLPESPLDRSQWPAIRTQSLLPLNPADVNYNVPPINLASYARVGAIQGNPSRSRGVLYPSTLLTQLEFTDLGYGLVRELASSVIGTRCAIPRNVVDAIRLSGVTILSNQIPWGSQTPARWLTLGRPEAWLNTQLGVPVAFPGAVYDTWAPEYNAETFASEFSAGLPTPRLTKYLPPYDRPLRGIQITIRTLEPRSGVVREFQIVHRF